MKKITYLLLFILAYINIYAEIRNYENLISLDIKLDSNSFYEKILVPVKISVISKDTIYIYPGFVNNMKKDVIILDNKDYYLFPEFSIENIKLLFQSRYYIKDSIDKLDKNFYKNFENELDTLCTKFSDFYYETKDKPIFSFTVNALTDFTSSDGGAFSSKGGFGVRYKNPKNKMEFGLIGTVSTNRDTMISQTVGSFARTILTPGVRSFSLMANFRWLNLWGNCGSGAYLNTTPMAWKKFPPSSKDPKINDSVPTIVSVCPTTLELYFTYVLFNSEYEPNTNPTGRINFDFGITLKCIGNYLSNSNKELFLGSHQDFFPGLIFGVDVHFSTAKLYFYGTYLPTKNQPEIDGLTNIQMTAGLSISSDLLKSK